MQRADQKVFEEEEATGQYTNLPSMSKSDSKGLTSGNFITRAKQANPVAFRSRNIVSFLPFLTQSTLGLLLIFSVFQPIFSLEVSQSSQFHASYWTDYRLVSILFIAAGVLPFLRLAVPGFVKLRRYTLRMYYHSMLNAITFLCILAICIYLTMSSFGYTQLPMLDQITIWIIISPVSLVTLKLLATVEDW